MAEAENFERFNLRTMSGVFAGSHTRSYQRLRLCSVESDPPRRIWAQMLWYDDPARTVLALLDATGNQVEGELDLLWQSAAPEPDAIVEILQRALEAKGWQLESCGTCAHWQANQSRTVDGFQIGSCHWTDRPAIPQSDASIVLQQSCLALACPYWTTDSEQATPSPQPESIDPPPPAAEQAPAPPQRSRWRRWLAEVTGRQKDVNAGHQRSDAQIEERSGLGAGTEPCLVCQGRMANLGAATFETPEGDKQTYSLWRCRLCFTTYLNSWIDRWERLDTLETEEDIYRLSPVELLAAHNSTESGQQNTHEAGNRQQSWFERLTRNRIPLSHQIRQGR